MRDDTEVSSEMSGGDHVAKQKSSDGTAGKRSKKKFKKAPDAPKRFKSSFMFFSIQKHKEIRDKLAREGKSDQVRNSFFDDTDHNSALMLIYFFLKTTNIAQRISDEWWGMTPEDREVWEEMARKDKARYEIEKAEYQGPWTVPIDGRRRKKDPSAPKRPMSAFLAFAKNRRAIIKRENPGFSNSDISRALSRMWKEAPDELRKKYVEEEVQCRKSYKVAMSKWREAQESSKDVLQQPKDSLETISFKSEPRAFSAEITTRGPPFQPSEQQNLQSLRYGDSSLEIPRVDAAASLVQMGLPFQMSRLENAHSIIGGTFQPRFFSATSSVGHAAPQSTTTETSSSNLRRSSLLGPSGTGNFTMSANPLHLATAASINNYPANIASFDANIASLPPGFGTGIRLPDDDQMSSFSDEELTSLEYKDQTGHFGYTTAGGQQLAQASNQNVGNLYSTSVPAQDAAYHASSLGGLSNSVRPSHSHATMQPGSTSGSGQEQSMVILGAMAGDDATAAVIRALRENAFNFMAEEGFSGSTFQHRQFH